MILRGHVFYDIRVVFDVNSSFRPRDLELELILDREERFHFILFILLWELCDKIV